jgi:hypothetical protein
LFRQDVALQSMLNKLVAPELVVFHNYNVFQVTHMLVLVVLPQVAVVLQFHMRLHHLLQLAQPKTMYCFHHGANGHDGVELMLTTISTSTIVLEVFSCGFTPYIMPVSR